MSLHEVEQEVILHVEEDEQQVIFYTDDVIEEVYYNSDDEIVFVLSPRSRSNDVRIFELSPMSVEDYQNVESRNEENTREFLRSAYERLLQLMRNLLPL